MKTDDIHMNEMILCWSMFAICERKTKCNNTSFRFGKKWLFVFFFHLFRIFEQFEHSIKPNNRTTKNIYSQAIKYNNIQIHNKKSIEILAFASENTLCMRYAPHKSDYFSDGLFNNSANKCLHCAPPPVIFIFIFILHEFEWILFWLFLFLVFAHSILLL